MSISLYRSQTTLYVTLLQRQQNKARDCLVEKRDCKKKRKPEKKEIALAQNKKDAP